MPVVWSVHVNTAIYVLSKCKPLDENRMFQYIGSVQSVLKGQQPNLPAAVCFIKC